MSDLCIDHFCWVNSWVIVIQTPLYLNTPYPCQSRLLSSFWNQNGEWWYQSPCQAWHSHCCWLCNSSHTHFPFSPSLDLTCISWSDESYTWPSCSCYLQKFSAKGSYFFSPTSCQTSKAVIWVNKLLFQKLRHGPHRQCGNSLGSKLHLLLMSPDWDVYHLMQGIISFKLLVHFICYMVIHARKRCRCTNATFWSVLWPWLEPSRGFVLMFNADYWGLTAMKESLFDGHDPAPVGD